VQRASVLSDRRATDMTWMRQTRLVMGRLWDLALSQPWPNNTRGSARKSNRDGDPEVGSAKLADAGLNLEALYVVRLAGDMVELALARQNSTVERL
jgi:hypothetical protein